MIRHKLKTSHLKNANMYFKNTDNKDKECARMQLSFNLIVSGSIHAY